MNFWIKILVADEGWEVELLMDGVDGDRGRISEPAGVPAAAAHCAARGKYHGMPITQHVVIDFRSKPATAETADSKGGVVRVYFEDNFSSAVICFPGKAPKTVRLDEGP